MTEAHVDLVLRVLQKLGRHPLWPRLRVTLQVLSIAEADVLIEVGGPKGRCVVCAPDPDLTHRVGFFGGYDAAWVKQLRLATMSVGANPY